jgi:hypothetical protein
MAPRCSRREETDSLEWYNSIRTPNQARHVKTRRPSINRTVRTPKIAQIFHFFEFERKTGIASDHHRLLEYSRFQLNLSE